MADGTRPTRWVRRQRDTSPREAYAVISTRHPHIIARGLTQKAAEELAAKINSISNAGARAQRQTDRT